MLAVMNQSELLTLVDVRRWATSGVARVVRERGHVSQAEIAEVCGVDASTVGLWERGQRAPSGEPARIYADLLIGIASRLHDNGITGLRRELESQSQPHGAE
jgi:transcriptional regulator with XRE-family HTH domain